MHAAPAPGLGMCSSCAGGASVVLSWDSTRVQTCGVGRCVAVAGSNFAHQKPPAAAQGPRGHMPPTESAHSAGTCGPRGARATCVREALISRCRPRHVRPLTSTSALLNDQRLVHVYRLPRASCSDRAQCGHVCASCFGAGFVARPAARRTARNGRQHDRYASDCFGRRKVCAVHNSRREAARARCPHGRAPARLRRIDVAPLPHPRARVPTPAALVD